MPPDLRHFHNEKTSTYEKHSSSSKNREERSRAETIMMHDGEGNLNWPLSVLLFRFTDKQANNTVNATGRRVQKVDCWRKERKKKETWLSFWESRVAFFLPQPQQTEKMKARRAAGGLLHHLTLLSSSRMQAQTEQTIQRSAQGGVELSSVSGFANTWLATPTTASASQDLFSAASRAEVRRDQVYKKGLMQHVSVWFDICWLWTHEKQSQNLWLLLVIHPKKLKKGMNCHIWLYMHTYRLNSIISWKTEDKLPM